MSASAATSKPSGREEYETMKSVVRCSECSDAARLHPFGFSHQPSLLFCSKSGYAVRDDDGCTFGSMGDPRVAVKSYDIDIGGNAAVHGW